MTTGRINQVTILRPCAAQGVGHTGAPGERNSYRDGGRMSSTPQPAVASAGTAPCLRAVIQLPPLSFPGDRLPQSQRRARKGAPAA